VLLADLQIGHSMNTNQKLEILNANLTSIILHTSALETDIALDPDADVEGKPTRAEVLAEFREKKVIIENMIATLTEEETL